MVLDKELVKIQEDLAKKVITRDEFSEIRLIGGVDQAFPEEDIVRSCAVVFDFENLKLVEKSLAEEKIDFPYVSGFLSFREGPSIIKAFKELRSKPDVLLVDGNGILHPRRIGLASHVGILLNTPTIGVAKSLLCGELKNNKIYVNGEARAHVFQSKEGCNPIYVSPGHRVSLDSSLKIVKKCMGKHKIPEPIRLAHEIVGK